jgi:hypothetical protein
MPRLKCLHGIVLLAHILRSWAFGLRMSLDKPDLAICVAELRVYYEPFQYTSRLYVFSSTGRQHFYTPCPVALLDTWESSWVPPPPFSRSWRANNGQLATSS